MAQYEFLPLCDVLFNIISLALYFCDTVFDIVMAYALFQQDRHFWFTVTISCVVVSLFVSQIVSLRWYLNACEAQNSSKEKVIDDYGIKPLSTVKRLVRWSVVFLHVIQFGILWRYFKLFIPVDLRFVKYEVRDLCMLRLLHAFCEGAPMLLIQLYLLWHETATKEFTDLNLVSMTLSLFSVCWALASFSKNVRIQNVHRLVLTWLGVIFQFMWRLGTVSARVLALTTYATLYGWWVFLVLGLHWVSMFLWLVSPNNVFHGERISRQRKAAFASLIAFVYIFAYINLQEVNHRHKMVIFYVVMGLENALLVFVCQLGFSANPSSPNSLPLLVFTLFFSGLIFQALYYRFFHVRRLNYEAGGRLSDNGSTIRLTPASKELVRRHSFSGAYSSNGSAAHSNEAHILHTASQQPIKYRYHCAGTETHHHGGIPGVFNCRFTNPYTAAMTKRKKKKPTSFVPPPSVEEGQVVHPVPFWCRPLHNHQGGSSENEGSSVGSRVNIQQKLQEKKQKQLAELRVIEEEIKQGKLHPPSAAPEPPPPPPPRGKQTPRPGTKEILLAPHYLDSDPIYRLCEDGTAETSDQMMLLMCKWYRVGSDIDSQVSLPRSYTLPREFKYYRRARSRRPLSSHHFTQSNNSSDGDVDSADDNDSESSQAASQQRPIRIAKPLYRFKHETKL